VIKTYSGPKKPLTSFFFSHNISTVLTALVVFLLIFTFLSPEHRFLSKENLTAFARLTPDLSIIALGVGLLMIAGEFDLSVGSIISYAAYIFVYLVQGGVSLYIVPFVVLAVGIGLGLLNGIITVKGRIPSFITTLGTMMLWRGILLGQSGGYPKPLTRYLIGNEYFVNVFTGVVGPVPIQAIWFGIFGLILGILLHFHKFGNWVYATGNNKTGARSMGINTDRVKIICFMIVGFLCAFTAMSISTHLRTSYPLAGHLYEMKAIAGSVIGGHLSSEA
jgi:simple sugar transport system permease protein